MNIQIFGKNKCFDTKKAQRYFKERNIKFQFINLDEKEMSKKDKVYLNQHILKTPIVRNGKLATVGYEPNVWKTWD